MPEFITAEDGTTYRATDIERMTITVAYFKSYESAPLTDGWYWMDGRGVPIGTYDSDRNEPFESADAAWGEARDYAER